MGQNDILLNMKIILPLLTLIAISVVCRNAFSMTLSELNDAIDSAESGATVYITSDIEVTETIEINKKVLTLASCEGECFKLIRTSGLNGNVLKVSGSGCDVTIENLAIDGNIAAGKYSDRLVAVADYAKLSMKEGSSVANGLGCGIELYGQSVLNMYDGSAITNFTGVAGHYGIGIVIGTGGNYPPTVNMYGGVVADCHGNRTAGFVLHLHRKPFFKLYITGIRCKAPSFRQRDHRSACTVITHLIDCIVNGYLFFRQRPVVNADRMVNTVQPIILIPRSVKTETMRPILRSYRNRFSGN